ncbi:hypothetical protein DXG01_008268 [Tephrocybe rancida]|nr:hypothetical protein DXG01_008268 [Tephrocybe rancida]
MKMNAPLTGFTMNVESTVTLLVCNLLVLVTIVYRRMRNGRDIEDDETSDYETTQKESEPHRMSTLTEISTQSESTNEPSFPPTNPRGTSLFLEAISQSSDEQTEGSPTASQSDTVSKLSVNAARGHPLDPTMMQTTRPVSPNLRAMPSSALSQGQRSPSDRAG